MKLLLSGLLLASVCARPSWSVSSGRRVVNQSPDVSVMEGETVNITCCWRRDPLRVIVNWLKNGTEINTDHFASYSQGSLQEKASDCSDLTFVNITREDSGRYTCKVTVVIPILNMSEGYGTVITVTARENTEDNTDPPIASGFDQPGVIIYAVRCLPLPTLITTFICLNRMWTKAQQNTPASPGIPLTSLQRVAGNQEEEERETEADGN